MSASPTKTLVESMLGMYYRLDTGRSGGRNVDATYRDLAGKWARLRDALEAGGYDELDNSPSLAAKFSRLERRHLLGKDPS